MSAEKDRNLELAAKFLEAVKTDMLKVLEKDIESDIDRMTEEFRQTLEKRKEQTIKALSCELHIDCSVDSTTMLGILKAYYDGKTSTED